MFKKDRSQADNTKTVDHTFMKIRHPFKKFSLVLYAQQEPSQPISEGSLW